MAHFAELDENNIVIRVIVVSNDDCLDENGQESEAVGIAFCQSLTGGGRWVQTSYNRNFRFNYAGIGYRYDEERDVFISPAPFPSWIFDEETLIWSAPVPRPKESCFWDEENLQWVILEIT